MQGTLKLNLRMENPSSPPLNHLVSPQLVLRSHGELPGIVKPVTTGMLQVPTTSGLSVVPKSAPLESYNLVNTKQVLEKVRSLSAIVNNVKFQKEEQKRQNDQKKMEDNLFQKTIVCKLPDRGKIQKNLPNLDANKISSDMKKNFYNLDALEAMGCISEAILGGPGAINLNFDKNYKIRRWITNLKQIGAPSVEGVALMANLGKSSESPFIVKAPKDPENNDLLHEWMIGVFGTNKLRSVIPTFSYIYGAFNCSPPIINPDKEVETWCTKKSAVNYVIYENIAPAKSINDCIKNGCTFSEWLNYYMQTLLGLDYANKTIGFTHYDLHTENLLIRNPLSGVQSLGSPRKEFWIPFPNPNPTQSEKIWIKSTGVSTLIDYGFSRIEYQGKSYGKYFFEAFGVLPDQAFPLHDAYKLLLMSMSIMKKFNKRDLYKNCRILLTFFTSENADDVVVQQRKTFYFLPYTEKTKKLTLGSLISYIMDNFTLPWLSEETPESEDVLSCDHRVCLTTSQTVNAVGLDQNYPKLNKNPINVFEYQQTHWIFEQSGKIENQKHLMQKFKYQIEMPRAEAEYDNLIKNIPKTFNLYEVRQISLSTVLSKQFTTQYKWMVSNLAKFFNVIDMANMYYLAISYTATSFNDTATVTRMVKKFQYLKALVRSFVLLSNRIRDDWLYVIDQLRANPKTGKPNEYNWWINGLPNELRIIGDIDFLYN